ncbi:MAG: hypothetical protein KGL35_30145 [Bradyrhizobium sp.]|nr:hypothetical protein [Bradyrhizobium sp.]
MSKPLASVVNKWKTNSSGAQTAFTDGVQSTQIDVMGRAIAAGADAVRNYADSISSGRWANAIQASGGTANWKTRTVAKAGNYSTGITANADKFQAAMGKLLPAMDSIVGSLPARQPGNVSANIERVRQLALALHARKGEFKG